MSSSVKTTREILDDMERRAERSLREFEKTRGNPTAKEKREAAGSADPNYHSKVLRLDSTANKREAEGSADPKYHSKVLRLDTESDDEDLYPTAATKARNKRMYRKRLAEVEPSRKKTEEEKEDSDETMMSEDYDDGGDDMDIEDDEYHSMGDVRGTAGYMDTIVFRHN